MNIDPQQPDRRLSEKADEMNASLNTNAPQPADADKMSDRSGAGMNERMTQIPSQDREVTPEYGDAADPASEELGLHHRDE